MSTLLLGVFSCHPTLHTGNGRLTFFFPAAWAGSLINGPVADHLGRKLSINLAVVIFVIGSAIQCGAVNIPMLFTGRFKLHIRNIATWLIVSIDRPSNCRTGRGNVDHGRSLVYLRGQLQI